MYLQQQRAGGDCVTEPGYSILPNREIDLVNWWLHESEDNSKLTTSSGERIIVLRSGTPNDGPGPDVLNSHIFFEDVERSGQIEMHWEAKSWYHHKHHFDPSYGNVILHVVVHPTGGPDLATLVVPEGLIGKGNCLAKRPVSQMELNQYAWLRYQRKTERIKELRAGGMNPLFLGIIEILFSGADRSTELQHVAHQIGLPFWPNIGVWRGSRRAYKQIGEKYRVLQHILVREDLFQENNWTKTPFEGWLSWKHKYRALLELGLSQHQVYEWIVNILAPLLPHTQGLELWSSAIVFRHYGMEKRMVKNMSLVGITTIMNQQAVLEWDNLLCQQHYCSICPLVRSYESLA